jgi:hypothetical protein
VGRVAEEDDVVRLEKGYYAKDGSFHDHIRYAFYPPGLMILFNDVYLSPQAQEGRSYYDTSFIDQPHEGVLGGRC